MKPAAYLAGAGQVSRKPDEAHPWKQEDPATLMAVAAEQAIADVGVDGILAKLDAIACVEPLAWTYDDVARRVGDQLGIDDEARIFWIPAGGNSPQDLLHLVAAEMAAGEVDCALVAGSEAVYSRMRAMREAVHLDWPERPDGADPLRGQKPFSSPLEQVHGLQLPIHAFPLFENGIRHAEGRSAEEQIRVAAELLARNARAAADNPYAWFRDAPSAETIATVTPENRWIAYPYTKRMNAIMNVDQGAAVIVVSDRLMRELGIEQRCAAIAGGAGSEDPWFASERSSFSESPAMAAAFAAALSSAGLQAEDLDALDLYSCFPSAVQMAMKALGMSLDDPRPVSLTGGLAYAGGPGNAYSMHSTAVALQRLREGTHRRILVTGLGMSGSKHGATVLTRADDLPPDATGETTYRVENDGATVDVVDRAEGPATIASYTIEYDRSGAPDKAIFILDLPEGGRTVANEDGAIEAVAAALLADDPIGRAGVVRYDGEKDRNRFALT